MSKLNYSYDCQNFGNMSGWLKKKTSDIIVIDDEWVDTMNKYFGSEGYDTLLHLPKRMIRTTMNVEMSDAQAWIMMYHILSKGVPQAIRDDDVDENTSIIAKGVDYVASPAMGVADSVASATSSASKAVVDTVSSPFKGKSDEEESTE